VAQLMLFSGNATPELSKKVSDYLAVPLGNASVGRFSDGEIAVEIVENVRGQDVFVLQSTCAPTNDNLMELVVLCDALRRASASRITQSSPTSAMPAKIDVHAPLVFRSRQRWWLTSWSELESTEC